jgi:hypothetical protein
MTSGQRSAYNQRAGATRIHSTINLSIWHQSLKGRHCFAPQKEQQFSGSAKTTGRATKADLRAQLTKHLIVGRFLGDDDAVGMAF